MPIVNPLPSLSVLMAVKDGMPDLPAAVESILKQTYGDFEFIIVDDGSTDGTRDYLTSLPDPRLRLLRAERSGQTAALNAALKAARAPWSARMDGDDVSQPRRLEAQMQAVKRNPAAVLISTDYRICDEALAPVAEIRLDSARPDLFLRYFARKNNPFCHPTMMFRNDAAQAMGGYDETLKNAQDYLLWKKLLNEGTWLHVPEVLLNYRVRKQSLSVRRHPEQESERRWVLQTADGNAAAALAPESKTGPLAKERTAQGLYAYKLGFAAWLGGRRWVTCRYLLGALRRGVRPFRALALLVLSVFPRSFYLVLAGYRGVYK